MTILPHIFNRKSPEFARAGGYDESIDVERGGEDLNSRLDLRSEAKFLGLLSYTWRSVDAKVVVGVNVRPCVIIEDSPKLISWFVPAALRIVIYTCVTFTPTTALKVGN